MVPASAWTPSLPRGPPFPVWRAEACSLTVPLAQHRAGGGGSKSLSEAGAQHEMQKPVPQTERHLTFCLPPQWTPGAMNVIVFGFF